MSSNQTQRPKFYEEQYLGAADLTAAVNYGRFQQARHSVGAHTWGIAIGLQLKETPQPGGAVTVNLLPGYAWDGYGRPIVVLSPTKIPEDRFSAIKFDPAIDTDGKGRLTRVWLRYDESPTQNPRPGFQVCDSPDQYARIQENFRIEIGDQPSTTDRYSGITIGTKALSDAKIALQAFEPSGPLIYDESIPQQTFPEPQDKARWLVPIGYVRWLPVQNAPGHFVPRDDSGAGGQPKDSDQIRICRRYIGVVTETIEAADGRIRLKNRGKDLSTVRSDDLVWVEGDLRIEGDLRLFNHKLDFRDSSGVDNNIPLSIKREEEPGKGSLQVLIGKSNAGANTFAVGPLDGTNKLSTKFIVRDDGKVGIGTTTPGYGLDVKSSTGIKLGLEGYGGGQLIIKNNHNDNKVFLEAFSADGNGSAVEFLLTGMNGAPVPKLSLKADNTYIAGNVGIGTETPENVQGWNKVLDLLGNPHAKLSVRTSAGIDARLLAHDAGWWGSPTGMIIGTESPHPLSFGTNAATRMVIDQTGNVGVGTTTPTFKLDVADRIRVRQGPAGGTAGIWMYQTAPNSDRAFVGMATDNRVGFYGNTGGLWGLVMDTTSGNVGIGVGGGAISPALKLDIQGDFGRDNGPATLSLFGSRIGDVGGGILFLRSGGGIVTFDGNDNVGIGTPAPSERLHVQGSLRVENDLYVVGQAYKWNGFTWTVLSDERLKENINPLKDALSRLLQLQGVSFLWRSSESTPKVTGPQMGLIAQQVEKVFPEWVTTTPDDHKALTLNGFEALTIEAIRELHHEVEQLKERLNKLSGDQSTHRERKKREPKEKST